jgi:hypothetical protein
VLTSGLKRFILWDYPRASWQFDVMVGVILVFIFLTPRSWFRDQPRAPRASQVAQLGAGHGSDVFWIEPELLDGVPENQRLPKVAQILMARAGRARIITRIEPVMDSEQEIKGYLAFARP